MEDHGTMSPMIGVRRVGWHEMGGLFGKVEGTGKIKGLRTPPSVCTLFRRWLLGAGTSAELGAWSIIICTKPEPTEHHWIPGGGGVN